MRAASLALLFVASCGGAVAPAAPRVAPPAVATSAPPVRASDPPPVVEGDVTFATIDGMQMLVKRMPGAELTAARLFVRGGVRNWGATDAGIEALAVQTAASGGTRSLDKPAFSRKLASLGATLVGDSWVDFSTLSTKAPRAHFDESLALMAEVFESPAMPASELELTRERMTADLRHEMESGDGRLWLAERKLLFAGHPYANRSIGTLESIPALKMDAVVAHLAKLRDRQRLLLVVAGDVDPAGVIETARRAFAPVARGAYVETPMPPLRFDAAHLVGDPFKLPTNYVQASFAAPGWVDPDFVPLWLGAEVLRHRVWEEVRTKRNLSYAPSASLDASLAVPYGTLYVTAVDPTAAMKVMVDEVRRLQTEPVPERELAGTRAVFLSSWTATHESTNETAWLLGQAQIAAGDWRVADAIPGRFRDASAADVARAAQTWMKTFQATVVGDPAKLDPSVLGVR